MILSKIQFNFLICALSIGVLSACGMEPLTSNDRDRNLANARALEYNDEVINGKLAPPKGFVQQSLFSQRVSGNDARFERLESAVQALHDTLKSHLPAIEKLSAIESDIEELVGQLQTLVSEPAPNAAPPIDVHQEKLVNTRTIPLEPETPLEQNRQKNSPAFKPIQAQDPIPSTPTPKLPPAPILDADYNAPSTARTVLETTKNIVNEVPAARTVNNIRVSQGPDKTRVVLDSTQKIDYTLEYDGQEGLVIVRASNVDVKASLEAAAAKSNNIMSITSSNEGVHTDLIFVLEGATSVSKGISLSPNNDTSQYRYFFDIF